jgi:hypothetical protein
MMPWRMEITYSSLYGKEYSWDSVKMCLTQRNVERGEAIARKVKARLEAIARSERYISVNYKMYSDLSACLPGKRGLHLRIG